MRKSAALFVIVLGSNAIGQSEHRQRIMSVCEVLADYARLADTPVVIVGRMDAIAGIIDRSDYLSEDGCEHPIVTFGHTWKMKIRILGSIPGMPKPPSDNPKLEPAQLAEKLLVIQRTTELGTHEEPVFKKGGGLGTGTVPNQWAAIYGVLVKSGFLADCHSKDCPGDLALFVVANPRDVHPLRPDGTLR